MVIQINIPSTWMDETEAKVLAKEWYTTYDIKATFNDGSDYYSTWSIKGYFEKVKKFLIEEYVSALGGEEFLDPEYDEDVIRIINMD